MIRARLTRLLTDEDGAVTADWLALTASAVVVGLLGLHIIGQSMVDVSVELDAALRNARLANVTFVESSSGTGATGSDGSVGSLAP